MARRAAPGWRVARLVDMGGGLVTAVSPDLLNDNEAQFAQCVDLSQKGTIRPALGRRDRYDSPFSDYPVRGIYAYYKKDGTSRLLMYSGGALYYDLPHFVRAFDSQPEWEQGTRYNLDTAAVPGDVKILVPGNPTFSRPSVAYLSNGTQVAANVPRFEPGKFGQAVMVEEGTTNVCNPSYIYKDTWTVIDYGWERRTNISCSAGAVFSISADVRNPSSAITRWVSISFYDSGGTRLASYNAPIDTSKTRQQYTTPAAPANTASVYIYWVSWAPEETYEGKNFQIEQKPYATSFTDSTRSPETLTIPTAGVLSAQEGTVEGYINLWRAPGTTPQYIFDGAGAANQNLAVYVGTDGKLCLEYGTGAATVTLVGTTVLAKNTWYSVGWRWSASGVALLLNGVVEASSATPPSLAFGANTYLGSKADGTSQLDGLLDDLRISSRARTDAEISAAYQSGLPLEWDEYTTYKLAFDGNLNLPADRKGVWVSPTIDVSTVQDKASGTVSYGATVPANTSLAIETRSSPDGATWSDWYGLGAGGMMNSPANNYVQVRARFATADIAAANPTLSWLKVVFDAEPAVSQLVSGLASEAEAFFGTLNDICIVVNGVDAPRKYDGSTVGLLGGSPPAAQYIAIFQNRVWLASSNANPSRVWFSELLDPETWPVLNFIDVAPDDGDRITGLMVIGDTLVITKARSTWLVLGDSPANFQVRCVNPAVGAYAPRSLANMDGKLVFANDSGVYLSDLTGFAVMTERVRPDWDAFNVRRLNQTLCAYANHTLYVFAPKGTDITNSGGLVYDGIRQAWLTLPFGASCACMFRELGHQALLFGDPTQGQVFSLDSTSDRGVVVSFVWESKAFDFGARESLKLARRVLLQVKPNGVAGQLKCYLRPDQGALKGPATVNYPATSEIVTLQFIAGAIGVGPFKTLSVRVENATKDARPEIHSIAIEFLVAGVEVD